MDCSGSVLVFEFTSVERSAIPDPAFCYWSVEFPSNSQNSIPEETQETAKPVAAIKKAEEERKKKLSLSPLTRGYSEADQSTKDEEDFIFITEGKEFPVHSTVMSEISPIFRRYINSAKLKNGNIVKIKCDSPEAFEKILKLIYQGTRSVSPALKPLEYLQCLRIAYKYCIDDLEEHLRTRLVRSISHQDVLSMLEFQEWSVQSKCWSLLERDTAKIISDSEKFVRISRKVLCDILENGRLKIDEYELFLAVRKWARHQMKITGNTSLAGALGNAVVKIRFPVIRRNQSKWTVVKKSGILDQEEIAQIESTRTTRSTIFEKEKRENICQCRKKGVNCNLCTSKVGAGSKGTAPSTTKNGNPPPKLQKNLGLTRFGGTTFNAMAATDPKKENPPFSRLPIPTASVFEVDDSARIPCDCFKYKSCPALPNGSTVRVLRDLGYVFL